MANYTMHGMITLHSNILSDLRTARQAGYDALEVHTAKLWRYIEAGGTAEHLKQVAKHHGIALTAIDIIGDLEAASKEARSRIQEQALTLCQFARQVECPIIQLNAFTALDALSVEQNLEITAENVYKVCLTGQEYGVRFQYEGAAWCPIHTLADTVKLVDMVNLDNFGLVIDFWHYWSSRGGSPKELAKLDKRYIFGVHVCDGLRPTDEEHARWEWQDESVYRKYLPGQGELPVAQWVDAVKATGYDGSYSGEFLNPGLWECDHLEIARDMRAALARFVED